MGNSFTEACEFFFSGNIWETPSLLSEGFWYNQDLPLKVHPLFFVELPLIRIAALGLG